MLNATEIEALAPAFVGLYKKKEKTKPYKK